VYHYLIFRPYNQIELIQMVMVRQEDDPAPEGVEYKHGLTPPMRDARRRRYRREPDLSVYELATLQLYCFPC
jgi:transcription initiation factor TFIID subunit 7